MGSSDGRQVPVDKIMEMVSGLRAIQELQRSYDNVGWRIENPSWAKVRHMLYHLTEALADLARLVESVEHAENEGAPPSSEEFAETLREHSDIAAILVFHAAQLANVSSSDLASELAMLWERNAHTFAPESGFATVTKQLLQN
jgi:hypothetical protein